MSVYRSGNYANCHMTGIELQHTTTTAIEMYKHLKINVRRCNNQKDTHIDNEMCLNATLSPDYTEQNDARTSIDSCHKRYTVQ